MTGIFYHSRTFSKECNIHQSFHIIQCWTKYLEQSKETQQKRMGTENFDNCFYLNFDRYYNFFSKRKSGQCALSPANFDILLMFPNFLGYSVIHFLATREASRMQCFQTIYQPLVVVNPSFFKMLKISKILSP